MSDLLAEMRISERKTYGNWAADCKLGSMIHYPGEPAHWRQAMANYFPNATTAEMRFPDSFKSSSHLAACGWRVQFPIIKGSAMILYREQFYPTLLLLR